MSYTMNAAAIKRKQNLLNLGVDIGEPLTEEHPFGNGATWQGFYAGCMHTSPELDEGWFTEDIQSPLVLNQQ